MSPSNPASLDHDSSRPQRSPGPRTDRGKRRSRQNARRHGMTAALPIGDDEAKLMQDFADRWTRQLGADTEAEEALIRASAVAYARFERCRKVEEASLGDATRKAVARWEAKQRHRVRSLAQNLNYDPINTVADLEATSFGCEWLLRHWEQLDAKLAQGLRWDQDDCPSALRMLGVYPQAPGPDADPWLRSLWRLARVCSGMPVDPSFGPPIDPVPARFELRRLIAEEIDRLDTLRQTLWESQDGPEAEAVSHLGLIDTTKDGQLRQRYRREAFSEMTRGINQLMRLRVERSKDQDRQWHQAHPHVSRKRVAETPSTGAGFPNRAAPDPAPPPPAAPCPVDSRNEPPQSPPEASGDRLNPLRGNEMRCEPSADPSTADQRTEPRFDGHSAPSDPSFSPEPSRPPAPSGSRDDAWRS
ncbi:hypothetical protein [Tautonia marina]|uniref:hypothetical protein n=1 Tax=Tautonia marina TaxID=2653855 RepID=UPI0012605492|nr:hypothetical protein [Tautonia marina]